MMTCRLLYAPAGARPVLLPVRVRGRKVLVRTIPLRLQQQSHQPRRPRQQQSHQPPRPRQQQSHQPPGPRQQQSHQPPRPTTTTKPPTTTTTTTTTTAPEAPSITTTEAPNTDDHPVRRQAFAELTAASAALRGCVPRCFSLHPRWRTPLWA
ncbi:putative mucin TcMUCI, partial [Trypanosoma cruzi]